MKSFEWKETYNENIYSITNYILLRKNLVSKPIVVAL